MVGLSPSTLEPASQGLPVYTVGDELWAASRLGSSLSASLSSPNFSSGTTLDPGAVALLHTFREADISGTWNLRLASSHASRTLSAPPLRRGPGFERACREGRQGRHLRHPPALPDRESDS